MDKNKLSDLSLEDILPNTSEITARSISYLGCTNQELAFSACVALIPSIFAGTIGFILFGLSYFAVIMFLVHAAVFLWIVTSIRSAKRQKPRGHHLQRLNKFISKKTPNQKLIINYCGVWDTRRYKTKK